MCVFVALSIEDAIHMRHIAICGLPHSTILFQLSHKRHDFRLKKVTEHKVCIDFLYNFRLKHFPF
jgi:hypothetical protein